MCGREVRRGVGGAPGGGQTTYEKPGGMQEEVPDEEFGFSIERCGAVADCQCDIAR